MGRIRSDPQLLHPACLSRTASSPSPSSDTNFSTVAAPRPVIIPVPAATDTIFLSPSAHQADQNKQSSKLSQHFHNLDLQLSTTSNPAHENSVSSKRVDDHSTQLQLSIGSTDFSEKNESNVTYTNKDAGKSSPRESSNSEKHDVVASRLKEQAREELRAAMAEKAYAEEARQQAKMQIEMAEKEFENAKRIRQQAQAEMDKAQALKEHAIKQINNTILQITCQACKQQFQAPSPSNQNSFMVSYISSGITEGEVVKNNRIDRQGKTSSNKLLS